MAMIDRRGVTISSVDPAIAGDPNPGLAIKAPVKAATTGANLIFSGLQTIDGVTLNAGDRVLVKDQTDQTTNGIYNAATGNWTRTIDAHNSSQFADGMQVLVNLGTLNGGATYGLTTADPIALGTSALTFAVKSLVGSLLARNNLSDVANAAAALANLGGAPLASPALTGAPTAPTPLAGDNSTRLATTAFVQASDALLAPLASPAFTGNPTAPTQTTGNNSTRLATTAFVQTAIGAIAAQLVTPETHGAVGDGVADDTAAVVAADTAAGATGTVVYGKAYRVTANTTLSSNGLFLADAAIKPDSGKAVTFNGQILAPDNVQIFTGAGTVTAPNQTWVSAAWWGMLPSASDAAPGLRAALASNRTIYVPPGSYTFASTLTKPYSYEAPPSILVQSLSNLQIFAYGATFTMTNAQALSCVFMFDGCTQVQFEGATFAGNRTGLTSGQQNAGISLHSVVDGLFQNLHFTGNWGGLSSAFDGDWVVDVTVRNVLIDLCGQGFDFGFVKRITIDRITASGADYTGNAANAGQKLFNLVADSAAVSDNHTGVSYTTSDTVAITNCYATNLTTAIAISAGSGIRIENNAIVNNPGSATAGLGIFVFYTASGEYASTGDPPSNVLIAGNLISGNGATVAGGGIILDSESITNSDRMTNIAIQNNVIWNNTNVGIGKNGTTPYLVNLLITGNVLGGASQTTNLNANLSYAAGAIIANSPRTVLTANATYYVLSTGSDSNTGLLNTAAGAFATIQQAINTVAALDCGPFNVTINVGAGTFTSPVTFKPFLGSGSVTIVGQGATTIISVTGGDAVTASGPIGNWVLQNVQIGTTTSGSGVTCTAGAFLTLSGVNFQACATYHMNATNNGHLTVAASYTISAGAFNHINCTITSSVRFINTMTVTLSGTPAFGGPVVNAADLSIVAIPHSTTTFSGSATGTRYQAILNSVIDTGGGGASFIPGNAAGVTNTGGVYG